MSECKVKITVDVCGESALDAVTDLVVNKKVGINAACKQVAKDFNSENDGATVKWATLKKSYQRANKVKPSGDMSPVKSTKKCSTGTVSKKLDVPIVTPKMQDDIDKLKGTCVRLRAKNGELQEKLNLAEEQVKELQAALLSMDDSPVAKTEQEQKDEFINAARKTKEEKAIAERKYFGVSEDGTPIG